MTEIAFMLYTVVCPLCGHDSTLTMRTLSSRSVTAAYTISSKHFAHVSTTIVSVNVTPNSSYRQTEHLAETLTATSDATTSHGPYEYRGGYDEYRDCRNDSERARHRERGLECR